MPTGKGGARKGERRPRGRKRAAGGKRIGKMRAGGAEVWVSHSGKRRGIGNVTEDKAREVRGGAGRGQKGEPQVDEIVEREKGPNPEDRWLRG